MAKEAGFGNILGGVDGLQELEHFAALVLAQAMEPAGSGSGHSAAAVAEAPTAPTPQAWTTYAHIHAIGFSKSGLFVKEPGGPFCVPVFFGEAQHIQEPFNDNV